jgi:hypothetical protein
VYARGDPSVSWRARFAAVARRDSKFHSACTSLLCCLRVLPKVTICLRCLVTPFAVATIAVRRPQFCRSNIRSGRSSPPGSQIAVLRCSVGGECSGKTRRSLKVRLITFTNLKYISKKQPLYASECHRHLIPSLRYHTRPNDGQTIGSGQHSFRVISEEYCNEIATSWRIQGNMP